MYKLCFFVPESCKEVVKKALFDVGAGRIGDYDSCCFESKGVGQFRPLQDSHPALGEHNKLHFVDEVKVEMVVSDEIISLALRALKDFHPYKEPAYDVFKCAEIPF
jgi:hypothetical protein